MTVRIRLSVQASKYQCVSIQTKPWPVSRRMSSCLGFLALIVHGQAHSLLLPSPQSSTGFSPFAAATRTYDSNLLNRDQDGAGPAPQSDQINRLEVGTHINLQLSRQRISGALALSDTQHERFKNRDTTGRAHRLRWDAEIGETVVGSLEGSSVSDQAPIQTGLTSAVKREQDNANASLTWKFHPNFSILNRFSKTNTRFQGFDNGSDSVLAGLNRDDKLSSIGLEYHPGTGNSLALLFKKANGQFPIRQITGPGVSVSNDFDQKETELIGKVNVSEITAFVLSLSSVERAHDEIPARDFSGTNYRLELLYKPTVKTQINLSLGKQIIGVSDATNSDALVRQMTLGVSTRITEKILLKLAYRPQNLQFTGTDALGDISRSERLKQAEAGVEYQLNKRLSLGANFRNRSRSTTLNNSDYAANSMSVFIKFDH